jgi:NAD(P)-dependent dehydrogenase (short-subunit alcohol dehydrogenase family)
MERTVIVGGTSGIGLATAQRLAKSGHEVVVTGRSPERLRAALDALPAGTNGRAIDAHDEAAMSEFFGGLGSVDHVVITVTAAAGTFGPVSELTVEQVREAVDGKLLAYVSAVRAVLPVLSGSGSITGVSALSAQGNLAGTSALAAANSAVEAWMRIAAIDLAPIRVNVVSPGVIDTPWWSFLDETSRQGTFDAYAKLTPVGRVGLPDDVAQSIQFLMESTFTTGVVLPCEGGVRLAGPQ